MTIKDIAKEAGYAVGTVSRVLNDQPGVSPAARERILDVIALRGFTPNSNAKHLKQQSQRGVAILVKGTRNMLFAGILELLQTELRLQGYAPFPVYLDESDNEVRRAATLCQERKPLGILFLGSNLTYFQEGFSKLPVPCALVTNSARGLGFPTLASVTTDDEAAAAYCIEHLYRKGHRNISVLGGVAAGSDASRARLAGCRRAFAALGLPFDVSRQYQSARYSMPSGYAAMEALLAAGPRPTAVFAFSDAMALGALRALRDHGFRVPEDISVMGFDGVESARYSIPRLTTIQQADEVLARRGAALLLGQIEDGAPAAHETVPFTLLEGESVRALDAEAAS